MKQLSDTTKWTVKTGDPTVPGIRQTGDGFNFSIIIENEAKASLLFYQKGSPQVVKEIPLPRKDRVGNVSSILIQGLDAGKYEYNYYIDGQVVQDPYARALTGRSVFGVQEESCGGHEVRCRLYENLADIPETIYIPYQDMILYKLHVRGYTSQRNSRAKDKGTFSGLVQKIPYLKELGITSIELMPAYDFEECTVSAPAVGQNQIRCLDEKETVRLNFWGYTGGFYFAPKAAYCAGDDPAAEFRAMAAALHEAGMELLMELYFDNGTDPIFIIDVLRFWKLTYGVDGFHLLGEIPIEIVARDALLWDTKLLYHGFDTDSIYSGKKLKRKMLAEYNLSYMETMRRFLKGDEDQVSGVIRHIKHNPTAHGVINYMTSQDGFTLNDLVSYDYRHNEDNQEHNRDGSAYNYSWNCGAEGSTRKLSVLELRRKQMQNSILFMVLSQGVPMIYSGDEIANSQNGNNNAYCQDNQIGWIEWSRSKRSEEMLAFTKAAIAFRKAHRVLHAAHQVRDTDYRSFGVPEISFHSQRAWVPNLESSSRQLGIMYCGAYAGELKDAANDYLYLAYNMHWEEQEFALPKIPSEMRWFLAVNTDEKGSSGICSAGEEKEIPDQRHLKVPPRTIIVLIGRQGMN